MAWCLPAALDAYVLVALRERRDTALAVGVLLVMVATSHLLSSEFLEMTAWVVIGVSSVAPLILWRVHGLLWGHRPDAVEEAPLQVSPAPVEGELEALQPQVTPVYDQMQELPAPPPPAFEPPLQEEPQTTLERALEGLVIDQETLVEKLVANGEPLPGRSTVMKTYGVSDWTARRALEIAKERLQENAETLQKTQEN
jgi:hypothetical protein